MLLFIKLLMRLMNTSGNHRRESHYTENETNWVTLKCKPAKNTALYLYFATMTIQLALISIVIMYQPGR